METRALGRQLLVEYYGCDADILNKVDHVREVMLNAARISGATIVGQVFHRFNPHGVSGVVVIAESHMSIHTWPEYSYAAVDLFTCGEDVDPYIGFDFLRSELNADRYNIKQVSRGLREEIGQTLHYKPEAASINI